MSTTYLPLFVLLMYSDTIIRSSGMVVVIWLGNGQRVVLFYSSVNQYKSSLQNESFYPLVVMGLPTI